MSKQEMTVIDKFRKLDTFRRPYKQDCIDYALLTLPRLIPVRYRQGALQEQLKQPWSSATVDTLGTHIATLMDTLFPLGQSFFSMDIPIEALQKLLGNLEKEQQAVGEELIRQMLLLAEDLAVEVLDTKTNFNVVKAPHLEAVTVYGENMLYWDKEVKSFKLFSIFDYVTERNRQNAIIELVVKEEVTVDEVAAKFDGEIPKKKFFDEEVNIGYRLDEEIYRTIFYHVKRKIEKGGKVKYHLSQYVEDVLIGEEEYDEDTFPFIITQYKISPEDNYGRGFVEEFIGDITASEYAHESRIKALAARSRNITLIDPASALTPQEFTKAGNERVMRARKDDVTVLDLPKYDVTLPEAILASTDGRLKTAALSPANTRQAERVTAEEIQTNTAVVQKKLVSVYQNIAFTLQQPLVKIAIQLSPVLQRLEKDIGFKPVLTTGLSGLKKAERLRRMQTWLQNTMGFMAPEAVMPYLKVRDIISSFGTNAGVSNLMALMKSEQEVQEEAEQMAQQQQMQQEQQMAQGE